MLIVHLWQCMMHRACCFSGAHHFSCHPWEIWHTCCSTTKAHIQPFIPHKLFTQKRYLSPPWKMLNEKLKMLIQWLIFFTGSFPVISPAPHEADVSSNTVHAPSNSHPQPPMERILHGFAPVPVVSSRQLTTRKRTGNPASAPCPESHNPGWNTITENVILTLH